MDKQKKNFETCFAHYVHVLYHLHMYLSAYTTPITRYLILVVEKATMALALSEAIRSFCFSNEAFPEGDCSQVVCRESSSTATLIEEEEKIMKWRKS